MQILASAPSLERRPDTDPTIPLPPRLLSALAFTHAAIARFDDIPEPRPGERTSERIFRSETHDIWLIRGEPAPGPSSTITVSRRARLRRRAASSSRTGRTRPVAQPLRRVLRELDDRPMAPSHIHEVANESDTFAASVHVYSPPLATMQHFDLTPASELRMIRREVIDEPESDTRMSEPRTVDELVDAARGITSTRDARAKPRDAAANGALLVDTRPSEQRATRTA